MIAKQREPEQIPQDAPQERPGIDPETLGHGPRGNGSDLPNVHQAIAETMHLVRAVGKWGQNREQNYSFRSVDDFMTALNPAMAKAGVHIVPTVLQRIVDESHKTSSNKVQRWVDLEVRFRIYGPAGDFVDVITWGESRDAADKATNKAMTAAFKYAILQAFMVPTVDLEDSDGGSPEAAPPEPQQQVRQQARAERRQSERTQAAPPVQVGALIAEALQGATTKTNMGKRLATVPGALVVEREPGKFAFNSQALREIEVRLDEGDGGTMSAWEAIGIFGASLPDELYDPGEPGDVEPVYEPPASPRAAQRRGPQDGPDEEDARWLTPVPEEES